MVIDGILDVTFAVIDWMLGLLPGTTMALTEFDEAGQYLSWVGLMVDAGVLGVVVSTIMGFEGLFLAYRLTRFTVKQIKLF